MPIEQDVLSVTIIVLIVLAIISRRKGQGMMETIKEMVESVKGDEE